MKTLTMLAWMCAGGLVFAQDKPGAAGNGDVVIGPDYSVDPDLKDNGNPKGKSFEFSMKLADSKIFRGDDATLDPKKAVRTERKIFVYVPAAYKDGTKAPLLVTFDGPSQLNLVRNALDNLTISKDPDRKSAGVHRDRRGERRQRRQGQRARARIRHDVRPPRPLHQRRSAAGRAGQRRDQSRLSEARLHRRSLGQGGDGLQLRRRGGADHGLVPPRPVPPPHHLFRDVCRSAGRRRAGRGEVPARRVGVPLRHEAHRKEREEAAAHLHARVGERPARQGSGGDLSQLGHGQQRTAAALKAKGYDYRFVFSKATNHCDGKVFEQTLADTLVWMWRGYRPE